MIKTQMYSGIFPPEIMLGCGMTEMSFSYEATRKCYQYHDATNSLMTVDVEHCPMGTRVLLCKDKVLRPKQDLTSVNMEKLVMLRLI